MGTVSSVQLAPANSGLGNRRNRKGMGSTMSPVKANAEALKVEETKAEATNKTRTGVGTRVNVGQTRGKNPSVVTWEAFNQDEPATLPTTQAQFMEVTKTQTEVEILRYLIEGFNKVSYSQASDEIGEYINDAWDTDTQAQFRLTVRNYAKSADMTIEEAANLLKPSVEKAFLKRQAALEAAKAEAASAPAAATT